MTPDPTPQPDHGAAGFCTDHAQVPDERTETVARVLLEHTRIGIWECACGGFHLYNGEPELRRKRHNEHQAAAVVAALDDESARLRASADAWWSEYDRELTAHEATKAEVERLARIVNGYDRTPAEQRAADAETDHTPAYAALDRVRAVHVEIVATARGERIPMVRLADLRAALYPEEPR